MLAWRWEIISALAELCFVEGDKRELYFSENPSKEK